MKTLFLFLVFFISIQFGIAQNNKMYISKKDGARNIFTLGKKGYDYYHFNNNSTCDTLICYGKGLIICKIDKNILNYNRENKTRYATFNKAIRLSEKKIRKAKTPQGEFELKVKDQSLQVRFYNADKIGNSDFEIVLLN